MIPRRVRGQVKFTLFVNLFTHLGFLGCPYRRLSVAFISGFVMFMDYNDFRLTDDGQLWSLLKSSDYYFDFAYRNNGGHVNRLDLSC